MPFQRFTDITTNNGVLIATFLFLFFIYNLFAAHSGMADADIPQYYTELTNTCFNPRLCDNEPHFQADGKRYGQFQTVRKDSR
jgi:hypothetical protein